MNTTMAANLLGRYVWLVDLIRRRRPTLKEINERWQRCGLSYGEDDVIPRKTFNNHKLAIEDIFGISIECDRKHGYRYYIADADRLEGDAFRSWLIDSFATLNQIKADRRLEGRILFEDIPSGHDHLMQIADAMRMGTVLYITYQGFGKPEHTFEIEPYYLKVVKRRWYVIARSPYFSEREERDVYLTYALDRITDISETDRTFKFNKRFDIDEYFEGCTGVIRSDEPMQRIVIAAYEGFADYLRTLPLHPSQRELESGEGQTLFEYHLKPTFDFYQLILAQGDQMEVIEPQSVRKTMLNFAKNFIDFYKDAE